MTVHGLESGLLNKSWNDRIEGVLSDLAGMIPEAGEFIQLLMAAFWPGDGEPDLWDQIKDEVESWVDKEIALKILGNDQQGLQAMVDDVRDALATYESSLPEKPAAGTPVPPVPSVYPAINLATAIQQAVNLRNQIANYTDYQGQLLPVWVTAAVLEMSVRRELLNHGAWLGDLDRLDADAKQAYDAKQESRWRAELISAYDTYLDAITAAQSAWLSWRNSLITFTSSGGGITSHGTITVTNEHTGETWSMTSDDGANDEREPVIRTRMMSEAMPDLAAILEPVYSLHCFVDVWKDAPPIALDGMGSFIMGPYSSTTLGADPNSFGNTSYEHSDPPGRVAAVNVRAANLIDGLQLVYQGKPDGFFAGSTTGGAAVPVQIEASHHATGHYLNFNNQGLFEMIVHQSGGLQSAKLGDAGNWQGKAVGAMAPDSYELVAHHYTPQTGGDGNATGVAVLGLEFLRSGLEGNVYPGRGWQQVVGNATRDIAAGGPNNTPWVIQSNGSIYGWIAAEQTWRQVGSGVNYVTVASDGRPYADVGPGGGIQVRASGNALDNTGWSEVSGWAGTALSLGAGGDGSVWIVDGVEDTQRLLLRLRPDQGWDTINPPDLPKGPPIAQVAVGAHPGDSLPWIVTTSGALFRRVGDPVTGTWVPVEAPAVASIAIGSEAAEQVWIVATSGAIYYRALERWWLVAGQLAKIAVDANGTAWGMNANGDLYVRAPFASISES